jgi:nitrite reductase/ring-hydroxylating ferredoxin subunit
MPLLNLLRERSVMPMDAQSTAGSRKAVRHRVGTVEELRRAGCVTTKVGSRPVCVFWDGESAFALDDRCPHMGFPLHRGTVNDGLLTCHWHHARFDLASGGTLDPFADDVTAYPVEMSGGEVHILVGAPRDQVAKLRHRLEEGLEQGISLVVAKAVLGLLEAGATPVEIVEEGVRFGTNYRAEGWGSGLTVLVAMANVLPYLDESDRPLALVHGLSFVSNDTRGHPPRFALAPLDAAPPMGRLTDWYRRFVDSRSGDAAERSLVTAASHESPPAGLATMMLSAVTDHVFVDEGHVLDFTNKAFECLGHVGWEAATDILPTLVHQTATARRHEEESAWRHPEDLSEMLARSAAELPGRLSRTDDTRSDGHHGFADGDVDRLGWSVLADEPASIVAALDEAIGAGATLEQLARAVAYAAALRLVRFHTQNDHGDWDVVHHAFTAANALHQCVVRAPSPELARGIYQCALRVYLDRFLNVPAARLPVAGGPAADGGAEHVDNEDLAHLQACWDSEGRVDDAGRIAYGYLSAGGDADRLVAVLGRALLAEDAGFHWFQIYEAAVRQHSAWPPGSEQGRLVLVGAARFLAAHTPTRRELSQVVRIAARLRRGEPLYEEGEDGVEDGVEVPAR